MKTFWLHIYKKKTFYIKTIYNTIQTLLKQKQTLDLHDQALQTPEKKLLISSTILIKCSEKHYSHII